MHAVIVGPTPGWDEWQERRRTWGADRWDEVWNGVLHVVPPPGIQHQRIVGHLLTVLRPLAARAGLEAFHQAGVFATPDLTDYREPDVVVVHPRDLSDRGIERHGELVIEVLSPHDERRLKFAFYAGLGIPEYWIVHPHTRAIEVYTLHDGAYVRQPEAPDGEIAAPRLGLALRVVDGPRLRITWPDGSADI
jgi:Uma2 family endonuclease